MPVTRFNDAALALLGLYKEDPALEGVPVYDSAQATGGTDLDYVIVGHDGTLAADGMLSADALAGTFTQADLYMPSVAQESGFVNCVIICQSGDATDAAARRQRASDLLGAAEDAAGANGGYPASAPGLLFGGTSDGRFVTRLSLGGVAVLLAYRVSYSTGW